MFCIKIVNVSLLLSKNFENFSGVGELPPPDLLLRDLPYKPSLGVPRFPPKKFLRLIMLYAKWFVIVIFLLESSILICYLIEIKVTCHKTKLEIIMH